MPKPAATSIDISFSSRPGNPARLEGTGHILANRHEIASAVLDTVEAVVLIVESSGRIVTSNRVCEALTGFSSAELDGKSLWELFPQQQECDQFRSAFHQTLSKPSRYEYQGTWTMRNDSFRWIEWALRSVALRDAMVQLVVATGIDRTERKRLENTVVEISGREQRRIGQDLHDGLGQHLTGIAFLTKVHERALAEKELPDSANAAKIVTLVNEAIQKTRELAHGLMPVPAQSHGLMAALQQWAAEVEDVFHITCRFECDDAVLVADDTVANHLYLIAQEAVHNAIKHGNARNVVIGLRAGVDEGALTVRDDGHGLPTVLPSQAGMGFRTMRGRAAIIGGTLHAHRADGGGTLVMCLFPITNRGQSA